MPVREQEIEAIVARWADALVPREMATVSHLRAEAVIRQAVQQAAQTATELALLGLLTSADVARELGVSVRRVQAHAKRLNERGFAVGWRVPGTRVWLFRPEEVESLCGGPVGRPKRGERTMTLKTAWVIQLSDTQYLGENDYAGPASNARRYRTRQEAKADMARLMGWPKAKVIRIVLGD
jgi:hypothetical protein